MESCVRERERERERENSQKFGFRDFRAKRAGMEEINYFPGSKLLIKVGV